MLKCNFFRSKNFNIFYDSGPEKILYNAAVRSYLAQKNSYLARKNFYLGDKFSYLRGRKPWFWGKKKEKTQPWRVLSSSLYKDTTFFAEIQIALTFRNKPSNVKKTRFAADGVWHVLSYEANEGRGVSLNATEASQFVRLHLWGSLACWLYKGRFYKLVSKESYFRQVL